VREKQRETERYRVGQEAAGIQPQTCPDERARDGRPVPPGEKQRQERYGVVKKQNRPMRFGAHSLTHGARAILMEGIVVKGIRRKLGRRHECKISYSCRRLGATAALFAAVPGARACGQRPRGMAPKTTRLRAHSLTHGMRAVLIEGIVMKGFRRKTGARHECKTTYSWRRLRRPSGAPRAGAQPVAWAGGVHLSTREAPRAARLRTTCRRDGRAHHAIWRAFSYSWEARDSDLRHCHERV